MFETFFTWLRRRAAESVLAGVNDAASKLQEGQESSPGPPLLLVWQPQEESADKPKRGEKVKASA